MKKISPYLLKKVIPIFGLTFSALFIAGCNKEEQEPDLRKDVKVTFNNVRYLNLVYEGAYGTSFVSSLIKTYEADSYVKNIYLVPTGDWSEYSSVDISNFKKSVLERVLDYSSKAKGCGDFNFMPGEASKVPEDSLWYVSKGWTINKYRTASESKAKHR